MANCNASITGYTRDNCVVVNSGVKSFYIGAFSADTTTWIRATSGQITGSTNGPKLYLYEMLEGTATASETLAVNATFKTVGVTQLVELVFVGGSQKNVSTYNQLLTGAWVVVVRHETSGEYKLFGEERGLERSAGVITPGVAIDDENTMRLTLTARASDAADTITASHVAALVIAAS